MAYFFFRHTAKKARMRFVGNLQTFSPLKILSNIRLTFLTYLYSMLLTADSVAVLIKGYALLRFLQKRNEYPAVTAYCRDAYTTKL